jgi:hypothetical protein
MRDAEAGVVKAVVMMSPNRGARAFFRGGVAFQDLWETGCKIHFYDRAIFGAKTDPLDLSTAFKRQMFGMILFGDEHQREQVRADTLRGMIQRVRSGRSPGIKTYGYRTVKVYKSDDARARGEHTHADIAKDEAEAAVVQRIFEMAARPMGDLKIARALNQEGVVGPGGDQWSKENVRNLLGNRLYIGMLVWGRTRSRDYHGQTGVRTVAPESEWVVQPMPHLRIVSDELCRGGRKGQEGTGRGRGVVPRTAVPSSGPLSYAFRHMNLDPGVLGAEDQLANLQAVRDGTRVFSAYELRDGTRIWIITEADRSVMTVPTIGPAGGPQCHGQHAPCLWGSSTNTK